MSDGVSVDHTSGSHTTSGGAILGRKDRLERVRNSVRMLAVAQSEVALYPSSHPSVLGAVRKLHESLQFLLERVDDVTFNIYRGILFLEDEVLPDETARHRRLVERLAEMGIGSLTFRRGLGEEELLAFVDLIGGAEISDSIILVKEALDRQGVRHIVVGEKSRLLGEEEGEGPPDSSTAKRLYAATMGAVEEIFSSAKAGKALDVVRAQNMVNELLEELLRNRATMIALASIKSHDEYTLQHSVNVCVLASALGATLSVGKDPLRSLGLSGLLYDVGKIRIPEEILKKSGPLTREEWDVVMGHSYEGAELLKRLHPSNKIPMVVAYEHHMRFDLQGYPRPPSGEKLHVYSRIVAICDAYDAMTTRRPFRRAIRPDQTVAILMQGRGRAYDPGLAKAFVNMLGIYPTGAAVRLSTGEVGVVTKPSGRDLLHPRVTVVIDERGQVVEAEKRRIVDTAERDGDGQWRRTIIDSLDADELGIDFSEYI